MGVAEKNSSKNITNNQRETHNASPDNIEKVDESFTIQDKDVNNNMEDDNQKLDSDKSTNSPMTQCQDSRSVNMRETSINQGKSTTKSESLPLEIKKHPGILVVIDFGGYNIEEKRLHDQ